MDIAALVTWVLTAGGGFTLLAVWLSHRRQPARVGGRGDAGPAGDAGTAPGAARLTPRLVFSHAGLAVVGLVLWIVYLATDSTGLARAALVVVLVVALLGFAMLARWIRGRRTDRPEDAFPVPVIVVHGVFAATTLVLVLLVALTG